MGAGLRQPHTSQGVPLLRGQFSRGHFNPFSCQSGLSTIEDQGPLQRHKVTDLSQVDPKLTRLESGSSDPGRVSQGSRWEPRGLGTTPGHAVPCRIGTIGCSTRPLRQSVAPGYSRASSLSRRGHRCAPAWLESCPAHHREGRGSDSVIQEGLAAAGGRTQRPRGPPWSRSHSSTAPSLCACIWSETSGLALQARTDGARLVLHSRHSPGRARFNSPLCQTPHALGQVPYR